MGPSGEGRVEREGTWWLKDLKESHVATEQRAGKEGTKWGWIIAFHMDHIKDVVLHPEISRLSITRKCLPTPGSRFIALPTSRPQTFYKLSQKLEGREREIYIYCSRSVNLGWSLGDWKRNWGLERKYFKFETLHFQMVTVSGISGRKINNSMFF